MNGPLAGLLLAGCAGAPPSPAPLVLLVSWDTTRADALSCYGGEGAHTPVADRLAREGVRFEWAIAQAPTTLSSHATVMTGLDPHRHGVVRNGYRLPVEPPTLAERLAADGWDTLGVVAAFPLEERTGIARGFRAWEDHGWLGWIGEWAVPAPTVVDDALDAVDDRRSERGTLLFVHFYDAHRPWSGAPDELRRRFVDPDYRGPAAPDRAGMQRLTDLAVAGRLRPEDARQARGMYLAQVARQDRALGRLLRGLDERGLLEGALVVLFGDHGEVLDEVPGRPYRHGPDVDLVATRVPLLAWGPAWGVPGGVVVEQPVRLQDVGATILSLAGVPGGLGDGVDLSPLWRGEDALVPPAFSEATMPHEETAATGWPNRTLERGVVAEGHLLTRAPWLGEERLFRLAPDQPPAEDPAVRARLGALLDAWDAELPDPAEEARDRRTRAALRALGYLDPG